MLVPLSWLRDYVSLPASAAALVEHETETRFERAHTTLVEMVAHS